MPHYNTGLWLKPLEARRLGLHLEADAELVAGLVQLGAVKVGGEGDGAAVPDLLLVAQTDLIRNDVIL